MAKIPDEELSFKALKIIYESEFLIRDGNIVELLKFNHYRSRFDFIGPLFETLYSSDRSKLPFPEFDTRGMSYEDVIKYLMGEKFERSHLKKCGELLNLHGMRFINNLYALKEFFEDDFIPPESFNFPHTITIPLKKMLELKGAHPLLKHYSAKRRMSLIRDYFLLNNKMKISVLFRRIDIFKEISFFKLTEEYVCIDGIPVIVSKEEEFELYQHYMIHWPGIDNDEIYYLSLWVSNLEEFELNYVVSRLPKKPKDFMVILRACRRNLRNLLNISSNHAFNELMEWRDPKFNKRLHQDIVSLHGLPLLEYTIEVPTCAKDLVDTASELEHCIDSYEDSIINKEVQVLNLIKGEKRFYTIALEKENRSYWVSEIRGFHNSVMEENQEALVIKVLQKLIRKYIKKI